MRFSVKANATVDGQYLQIFPSGDTAQWMATTEADGHWYVNIAASTDTAFGASGVCN